jgi:hypothetical protein
MSAATYPDDQRMGQKKDTQEDSIGKIHVPVGASWFRGRLWLDGLLVGLSVCSATLGIFREFFEFTYRSPCVVSRQIVSTTSQLRFTYPVFLVKKKVSSSQGLKVFQKEDTDTVFLVSVSSF